MHIVHVYDGHEQVYEGKGSLPRIIWNVARRTAERGHDVTVLERRWAGLDPHAQHEGVSVRRLRLRTGGREPWERVPYEMVQSASGTMRLLGDRVNFGLRLRRALRGLEYDVIHAYLPFAANVLAVTTPRLRDRLVYTAQLGELRLNALTDTDSSSLNAPAVLKRFSPDVFLAKRTARTTVLNEHVRDIFARSGVPVEKLVHVPNGVDYAQFQHIDAAEEERVRSKYSLDDRPTVLFVGTVMPRKGVIHLVEAARAGMADRGLEFQLVVAGETDLDEAYMERVNAVIEGSPLEGHIVFTGYLRDSDLLPLYSLADVFVLPSFEEGFGMVVSEAMAAGTPVIASDISGVRQQVVDGETGLLVQPGDAMAIESALSTMLADPEKRRSMGAASREYAHRFSWETVTDQYLDVYRAVIDES